MPACINKFNFSLTWFNRHAVIIQLLKAGHCSAEILTKISRYIFSYLTYLHVISPNATKYI